MLKVHTVYGIGAELSGAIAEAQAKCDAWIASLGDQVFEITGYQTQTIMLPPALAETDWWYHVITVTYEFP